MTNSYDLVIKNATVIDGTGNEGYSSDIAVKNGKIAKIANDIEGGKQIIDASGLTLTPGWIDSHSHSDRSMVDFSDQKEKIEQGITFSITGQCGSSPAPKAENDTFYTMGNFIDDVSKIPQGSSSHLRP